MTESSGGQTSDASEDYRTAKKFIRIHGLMRNSPYLDARQHHIAICLDATCLVKPSRQGKTGNAPTTALS